MGLIVIFVLIGAAIATLFRTLALSPLSEKLTEHRVWVFDFGTRYAMLAIGLAFFTFLVFRIGLNESFFILFATWLIGLAAIWILPPYLSTFF